MFVKKVKKGDNPNANIVKRVNGKDTPIKEGVVVDNNIKTSTLPNYVGVNIGGTINMGNFESLRIDVWSVDNIKPNETRQEALERVAKELENSFISLRDKYAGNKE